MKLVFPKTLWKVYNPSKRMDDFEQVFSKINEGTIKMRQVGRKISLVVLAKGPHSMTF